MSLFDSIRLGASGVSAGYEIERSLRFERGDSAYLSRTAGNPTNQNKFSFSCWVKRSKIGQGEQVMYGGGGGSQTNSNAEALLYFTGSDQIAAVYQGGLASCNVGWFMKATRKLRDPSAWMHFLSVWDGTLSGDSNRIKFYVNGVQDPLEHDCGSTSAGFAYLNKNGHTQYIGREDAGGGPYYASFYMAEAYFVDGTACVPSDFIETSSTTGQVVPKNSEVVLSNLTMGNNGFYLNFSDNSNTTASTLGKDYSGNGNNWTPHNFSVSAGVGNDSLEDTPTNNFPTFNPLNHIKNNNNYSTLTQQGSLLMRGGDNIAPTTFLFPKSGKWYLEVQKYGNGAAQAVSIVRADSRIEDLDGNIKDEDLIQFATGGHAYARNSDVGVFTNWENNSSVVIGVAVDMDNGAVYFAVNNTWQNSGNPTSGSSKTGAIGTDLLSVNNGHHYFAGQGFNANDNYGLYVNFGQRAFTYTPPTGYEKLCSKNLPDPTVVNGTEYFNPVIYSGNGGTQSVSGVGFQPDWTWIKSRSGSYSSSHYLVDDVRATSYPFKRLNSDSSSAEGNTTDRFMSFDSDGFTVKMTGGGGGFTNGGSQSYVAWNWKEDTTAGFDIVLHNVNQTSTDFTISHGLGVTPDAIFAKNRDSSHSWRVFHRSVGTGRTLFLDTTDSSSGNSNRISAVTSSNFTIRTNIAGNFVFYVFSEVDGFSKFGQYYGNGNSSNGAFVYLGFKPAVVIIKKHTGSDNWEIYDNARDLVNPNDSSLFPNTSSNQSTGRNVDFLSNGFMHRNANGNTNENGHTYAYFAWAESPFKHANAE